MRKILASKWSKGAPWREEHLPTIFRENEDGRLFLSTQGAFVAWFFSRTPSLVWFISFVFGIVAFVWLPKVAQVHALHERRSDGRLVPNGIWYEPGWMIMFVFILPLIFALCSTIAHKARKCLAHLDKTVVVRDPAKGGDPNKTFVEEVERILGQGTKFALLILLLSCTLAAADGCEAVQHHSSDYVARKNRYQAQHDLAIQGVSEWLASPNTAAALPSLPSTTPPQRNWTVESISSLLPCPVGTGEAGTSDSVHLSPKGVPPQRSSAWWYLLVAYASEALALFLGCSFVVGFFRYLTTLGKLFRWPESGIPGWSFKPLLFDPERRLGLGCLGDIVNRYLVAVLLLQVNVLLLRLDRIARSNDLPIYGYPDELLALVPALIKAPADTFRTLYDLSMRALGMIRTDEWFFLVFVPLGYFACIVLPLFHLRRYLEETRLARWADVARDYEEQVHTGDEKEMARLRKEVDALSQADPWPNGHATASKLLGAVVALALGAWLPPILVYLIALGIGISIYSWLSSLVAPRVSPLKGG